MAQQSSFFNAQLVNGAYDRTYNASNWASYFSSFLGNGVAQVPATTLAVQAGTGLNVIVDAGTAFINGYMYQNTTPLTLALPASNQTYNFICSVVVELNLTNREITAQILQGTPAPTPVAPTLTTTTGIYQLQLATVLVTAGSTQVIANNITDTRSDTSVCGYIAGLFGVDDDAEIEQQISQMNENITNLQTNSLTEASEPVLDKNWSFENSASLLFNNTKGVPIAGQQVNTNGAYLLFNNNTGKSLIDFTPVATGIDTLNVNSNVNFNNITQLLINNNQIFDSATMSGTIHFSTTESTDYTINYSIVNGGTLDGVAGGFGVMTVQFTPNFDWWLAETWLSLAGLEPIYSFYAFPIDSGYDVILNESEQKITFSVPDGGSLEVLKNTTLTARFLLYL